MDFDLEWGCSGPVGRILEEVTLSSWEEPGALEHVGRGTVVLLERMVLGCSLKCVTGTCAVRRPAARTVPWVQSVPMGGLIGGD